jgi:hypothetical protein
MPRWSALRWYGRDDERCLPWVTDSANCADRQVGDVA